jgi:hypothetical protein
MEEDVARSARTWGKNKNNSKVGAPCKPYKNAVRFNRFTETSVSTKSHPILVLVF